MNSHSLSNLAIQVFLFTLFALFAIASLPRLDAKTDRLRIVWIEDPATTAVLCWNQASGENPVVHYDTIDHGSAVEKYKHSIRPARRENYMDMDTHVAYLENLAPGSPHYFIISDSGGAGPRLWFRTAPAKPEPFTFIAGGDTKSDPIGRQRGRKGNRMVANLRPLFVLFDGDFTSGKGLDPGGWRNWLKDWAKDTLTADDRVIPIVPVRGNHEADPEILFRLFGLKDPDNYFAFNVGGNLLRVYALNSQIHVNAQNADDGGNTNDTNVPAAHKQTNWLRADLKDNRQAKFKVAAYHKPFRPHTSGKPENDYLYNAWAATFYKYRLTLAVEGDSHMHKITYPLRPSTAPGNVQGFVRDDKNGTMFIGEGSWGANTRANDDDKPWTLHSANVSQLKWVHVHTDHLDVHAVPTKNADKVYALTEETAFSIPPGLELVEIPPFGNVVKMPFHLNPVAKPKPVPAAVPVPAATAR